MMHKAVGLEELNVAKLAAQFDQEAKAHIHVFATRSAQLPKHNLFNARSTRITSTRDGRNRRCQV